MKNGTYGHPKYVDFPKKEENIYIFYILQYVSLL